MSTPTIQIIETGHEWLGYINGHVVAVYPNQYTAERYLRARKVQSTAPVAQVRGTEAEFIGTVIAVGVTS